MSGASNCTSALLRCSRRSTQVRSTNIWPSLAHHYGRSANLAKAVLYLTRAGQQALNRSAFAEAQAQLQQGPEWIKKLSESPERDARASQGRRDEARTMLADTYNWFTEGSDAADLKDAKALLEQLSG